MAKKHTAPPPPPVLPTWPDAAVRPFLRAMRAAPDDDGPALVFADWLEEHGDPRGEMVRLSVQTRRLPPDSPAGKAVWNALTPWFEGGAMLEAWVGEMAEGEFWISGLTRGLLTLQVNANFGGMEKGEFPLFEAAFKQGWVDRVQFGGMPADVLSHCPLVRSLIRRVDRLDLYDAGRYYDDRCLAGAKRLANLTELIVEENHELFTDAVLAHVRGHPRLERVSLRGNYTRKGFLDLMTLPQLRYLSLGQFQGLTDADVDAVVAKQTLRTLEFGGEGLTEKGLLKLTALRGLERLSIHAPQPYPEKVIKQLRAALPHCQIERWDNLLKRGRG